MSFFLPSKFFNPPTVKKCSEVTGKIVELWVSQQCIDGPIPICDRGEAG